MSKNLADNIVALRKKHGLSQEQFAEKSALPVRLFPIGSVELRRRMLKPST